MEQGLIPIAAATPPLRLHYTRIARAVAATTHALLVTGVSTAESPELLRCNGFDIIVTRLSCARFQKHCCYRAVPCGLCYAAAIMCMCCSTFRADWCIFGGVCVPK